jgi:wyosine [tRNA(Phe)-imidazoG37] synthetase (radical SAM superfamily)
MQTERESFFPKEEILSDIERAVTSAAINHITFVGDGEPTLCADLGWLIRQCKARWSVPVAVITNGALLWREDVREDLVMADVVLPSLDAATRERFALVNRPHPSISLQKMVQGQYQFRSEYRGQIWSDVMLVSGLNDSDRALRDLKATFLGVQPDRIYVNVPIRPPAEEWVEIPDLRRLVRAMEIFDNVKILDERDIGEFGAAAFGSAAEAIMQTSARHPLREQQARAIETRFGEVDVVESLERAGQLIPVQYDKQVYLVPSWFTRGG